MKIKDNKCKCGHNNFFFAEKGNQTGIYCSYCGKWLKWADKNEQNLRMKQVSGLDKIRAEIEDLDRFYDNDYFSGNRDSMFKCNEVMQIIDKYRKEQE